MSNFIELTDGFNKYYILQKIWNRISLYCKKIKKSKFGQFGLLANSNIELKYVD